MKELQALINAIRGFRHELAGEIYTICRKDGQKMGLGEVMYLGHLMENIDLAIIAAEEAISIQRRHREHTR